MDTDQPAPPAPTTAAHPGPTAGPASKPAAACCRSLAAGTITVLDRFTVGLTIVCAASLFFGSHGAHPSNVRDLQPIMVFGSAE